MVIYVIENKINHKKYVGQTKKTSEQRWKEHTKGCESCRVLQKAIKKYGEDSFEVYDIDHAETHDELDEKEKFWISKLNTMVPNGYNLTSGGETRKFLSKESREKISASKKGKHLSNEHKAALSKAFSGENHPLYGTHRSEETKRKISEANKGKLLGEKSPWYGTHISEERKKLMKEGKERYYKEHGHPLARKVVCVETGNIYSSATQASKETGIDNSSISKVCKGIYKTAKGFHWEFVRH